MPVSTSGSPRLANLALPGLAVVALLLSAACRTSQEVVPARSRAPAATTALQEAAAPIADATTASKIVWLWDGHVGRGELDELRELYLADAEVVHRLGEAQGLFDREAWLAYLGAVRRAPVDARHVYPPEVTFEAGAARVRYRFSWHGAPYAHVGHKELLLRREGDALKIARETFLTSKILRSNRPQGALAETALVTVDDSVRAIVGRAELAHPAHGPIHWFKGEDAHVLSAAPNDLPPPLSRWQGKRVRMVHESGMSCAGWLEELMYTVHLPPEEAQADLQLESNADPAAAPVVVAPDIEAMMLWDERAWAPRPVAARVVLVGVDPPCSGAPLFVRDAALPRERVARSTAVPRREEVLAAYRSQPEYLETQTMYKEEVAQGRLHDPTARWDDWSGITLQGFRFSGADETLVSVTVAASDCGDWTPSSWIVFGVPERGPLTVRKPYSFAAPARLALIVDLDDDGRLEYVARMLNGQTALIDSEDDTLDAVPAGWPRPC